MKNDTRTPLTWNYVFRKLLGRVVSLQNIGDHNGFEIVGTIRAMITEGLVHTIQLEDTHIFRNEEPEKGWVPHDENTFEFRTVGQEPYTYDHTHLYFEAEHFDTLTVFPANIRLGPHLIDLRDALLGRMFEDNARKIGERFIKATYSPAVRALVAYPRHERHAPFWIIPIGIGKHHVSTLGHVLVNAELGTVIEHPTAEAVMAKMRASFQSEK